MYLPKKSSGKTHPILNNRLNNKRLGLLVKRSKGYETIKLTVDYSQRL
ncbi:hypothetical protein N779_00560 [Vibrio coralliilyticus OCN008]|nr:hypothetical protein N779_00560 [Vibrio coralliilyticus OCN008]